MLGLVLILGFAYHRNLLMFLAVIGWLLWIGAWIGIALFFWRLLAMRFRTPFWLVVLLFGCVTLAVVVGLVLVDWRSRLGLLYNGVCVPATVERVFTQRCVLCRSGKYAEVQVEVHWWWGRETLHKVHYCPECVPHQPVWLCYERTNPWNQVIVPGWVPPDSLLLWLERLGGAQLLQP